MVYYKGINKRKKNVTLHWYKNIFNIIIADIYIYKVKKARYISKNWVQCATKCVKIRHQVSFCLYVYKKTLEGYTTKWNKMVIIVGTGGSQNWTNGRQLWD